MTRLRIAAFVACLALVGLAAPADARTGHEPTLTLFFGVPNPAYVGEMYTIRAFVTAYEAGPCAEDTSGSVTFRVSGWGDIATVAVVDHLAELPIVFDEPGRYRITVKYSGDANCARSRDSDRRDVLVA